MRACLDAEACGVHRRRQPQRACERPEASGCPGPSYAHGCEPRQRREYNVGPTRSRPSAEPRCITRHLALTLQQRRRGVPARLRLFDLVALLVLLQLAAVLAHMVDAQRAVEHDGAVEIVDGEHGAALVLVHEEAEAAPGARLLGARQADVENFAVLREDGDDVALGERRGQAADENVGAVCGGRGCVRGSRAAQYGMAMRRHAPLNSSCQLAPSRPSSSSRSLSLAVERMLLRSKASVRGGRCT